MASPRVIKQAGYPEGMPPTNPSRLSLSDDEDSQTVGGAPHEVDDDALSILSMVSYPDFAGRKGFTVDEPSKTVYEAWEITSGEDTMDWVPWKTICGINVGVKWQSLNDGFLDVNPLTSYGQEELAELHTNAVREYEARGRKKGRSYAQDLANRVFRLDADIYNRAQHLVDDKLRATNKTPFRRREWKIVVLEEGEFQVTELLPERKKGLFRRRPEKPGVAKYFLVLRGEEVKTTKEDGGWRLFNRHSNPWWRIDARETREARLHHQEYFKKVNRTLGVKRGPIVRNPANKRFL